MEKNDNQDNIENNINIFLQLLISINHPPTAELNPWPKNIKPRTIPTNLVKISFSYSSPKIPNETAIIPAANNPVINRHTVSRAILGAIEHNRVEIDKQSMSSNNIFFDHTDRYNNHRQVEVPHMELNRQLKLYLLEKLKYRNLQICQVKGVKQPNYLQRR